MRGVRTDSPQELELGDYVAILRRRWIFVLLPVLVVPWAAFFLSASQPDQFVSEARVLLGDTAAQAAVDAGSQSTAFRNRLLENELRLATGDAADADVARRFGVAVDDVPTATITAETDADIIVFRSTSPNPETAANVANAWADAYLDLKAEQTESSIDGAVAQLETKLSELQAERDDVRSDLGALEERLARATDATRNQAQLRVDREASAISGTVTLIDAQIAATASSITNLTLSADLALGNGPRIIGVATPAENRSNAPVSRNIVLGLVVGAILGAALALLRENLDTAVRTPQDLEDLGLVHLGSIPTAKNTGERELALASLEDTEGPQAAAYQKVRSAIEFMSLEDELNSIVVTSANQGEGKTTAAANLATAMAQANKRTILLDCDLRRPRVHKVFRTKQTPGITNVVLDSSTLAESAWPIPALAESLVVVPSGALPPHPASFIASPAFASATKQLTSLGDFTVIDGPPLLPVADTLSLAHHVSGVLIVVDAGRTSRDDVERALASLTKAGARVIGAVLIGVKQSAKSYTYAYSSDEEVERLTMDEATRTASGDDEVTGSNDRPAFFSTEAEVK